MCSSDTGVQSFVDNLVKGKMVSWHEVAMETLRLSRSVICDSPWDHAGVLLDRLKGVGQCIQEAQPTEAAAGCVIRRVLKIVRDEYRYATLLGRHAEGDPQESLHNMLRAEEHHFDDYTRPLPNLKEQVLDGVAELETELETSADNIAAQSLEHIHSDEVIMTAGRSRTVEAFLKKAAKKRRFQVVVVEMAPFCYGQDMANRLASQGEQLQTTLIPDSAVFAIMSRVNKVILGTHSILANGGLKAVSGMHGLALAAKHYSVPIIVCASQFKLVPQYLCSYDQDAFNRLASPLDLTAGFRGKVLSDVHLTNPVFDYVPPELVTLFIFNIGGSAPSYVYRLLSELYHLEDYDL